MIRGFMSSLPESLFESSSLDGATSLRTFTAPEDLQDLEKRIKDIEIDKAAAVNAQDFERAASLRDKEKELQEQLERAKDEWASKNERSNSVVVPGDIADIVSMWT